MWQWYREHNTDRQKVWCGQCIAKGMAARPRQLVGCRQEDLKYIHNHSNWMKKSKKKKLQVCDSIDRQTKRKGEDTSTWPDEVHARIRPKQAVAILKVPVAKLRPGFKCIDLETHNHANSSDYLIMATTGPPLVFKAILRTAFAADIVQHFVPAIAAAFAAKSMLYATIIDMHNLIMQGDAARSQEPSWSWTDGELNDILQSKCGKEYVYDTRTRRFASVGRLCFSPKMSAVWESVGKKSRAFQEDGARKQTRPPHTGLSRVMVVGDKQAFVDNQNALFKLFSEADQVVTSFGLGGFSGYDNRPTGAPITNVPTFLNASGHTEPADILQASRTWLMAPMRDNT